MDGTAARQAVGPGRFLFVELDGGGNVQPTLGLVRRLVARGHRVRIIADRPLRARIEAAGGIFRACPAEAEWDPSQGRAFEDNREGFIQHLYGMPLAEGVLAEIRAEPADALAVDCMLRNGLCAAEALGLPTAVLVHYRYGYPLEGWDPAGSAPFLERLNELRARIGLAALASSLEEPLSHRLWRRFDRTLVLMPREFEDPQVPLDTNARYVGPIFEEDDRGVAWDLPWPPDHPEPLVVVSLGTTYMHHETVTERVLAALESLPVRTLLTLGAGLGMEEVRIPAWAVVRPYVPHIAVLPHAALVVTHAGMGTINAALAHGVPMLCLPFGRDQIANAARVAALGAGRAISRDATVEEIRTAAVEVLRSDELRAGARRMAEVIRGYGSGVWAIAELESLLESRLRVAARVAQRARP